jgi:hypothetical protein
MSTQNEVAPSPFRRSLNRLRRRRPRYVNNREDVSFWHNRSLSKLKSFLILRSAPPRSRTPLIEHHYQFDTERKEVLPGVPEYDNDLARDSHDYFNLVVLIPIIALNVMNWDWDKIFSHIGGTVKKKETLLDSWTGEWFDAFFYATALYFCVDLVWIMVVPKCVKSPSTIIQHHTFTMLYILIPYFRQDKRWAMGAYMSVEVSDSFKTFRKGQSYCQKSHKILL